LALEGELQKNPKQTNDIGNLLLTIAKCCQINSAMEVSLPSDNAEGITVF
jgi:hypothetical protein